MLQPRNQQPSYHEVMAPKMLSPGKRSDVALTALQRGDDGRWKTIPEPRQGAKVQAWRARCTYRDGNGEAKDLSVRVPGGRRKVEVLADAEARIDARLREKLAGGLGPHSAQTPFVEVGREWLNLLERPDSGRSARTVREYRQCWGRFVDCEGGHLRGLRLDEVNQAQTLRRCLQSVADASGTGSAKMLRSVLSGILQHAVDDGLTTANAMRSVRAVKSSSPKATERDTRRAFTPSERAAVMAHADAKAKGVHLQKRSEALWATVADLTAFLAGTGCRIGEALGLRWEHVHLVGDSCPTCVAAEVETGPAHVHVHGTKSASAVRRLDLPGWLTERLTERKALHNCSGFVFHAPNQDPRGRLDLPWCERPWDQAKASQSMRTILTEAGHPWATAHTLRRTVATMLSRSGLPLVDVADQLGHSDPSMTASVYLGRNWERGNPEAAAHL